MKLMLQSKTETLCFRTITEASKFLGVSVNTIRAHDGFLLKGYLVTKIIPTYTVYRGDVLLGSGTLSELSELTGLKKQTLVYYMTKIYETRRKDTVRTIYIIKD